MKIKPCDSGPGFWTACRGCGKSIRGGENVPADATNRAHADLSGEPFRAYYCPDCARGSDERRAVAP